MNPQLKIDTEFMNLTSRISESEYTALEENLFDNGCKHLIHVWDGIIIDGHKRYKICKKWNIPFTVQNHHFEHRFEAIIWICENNIAPPSDSGDELRKYQIGKHYEASKEKFLSTYTEKRMPRFHYKIAIELSGTYNVVPNTIYKYGVYARCIDNIYQKDPTIVEKILSGSMKISHDNVVELSRLPKDQIRRLHARLNKSQVDHIGFSEMRHELRYRTQTPHNPPRQRKTAEPQDTNVAIKQMPEYDPDAEISSLALTIPSWISSIHRTRDNANLSLISETAQKKIKIQLANLSTAIYEMLAAIEEET